MSARRLFGGFRDEANNVHAMQMDTNFGIKLNINISLSKEEAIETFNQ
jgi:hypothetical protein